MMLTAPRTRSTAGDLLRLAALWLAAILLVQGVAAALALGAGPLHHHRQRQQALAEDHLHAHADGRRHHHAADAGAVIETDAATALDDAALALVAALALMAAGSPRAPAADGSGPVRRAIGALPIRGLSPEPLLRPPRSA
jgi:hypothetical protein